MPGRQQGYLTLGRQLFDVESGDGVEGPVQQSHIDSSVAEQLLLLAHSTQQHLDRHGVRLAGVRVVQLREQLHRGTCFGREDEA